MSKLQERPDDYNRKEDNPKAWELMCCQCKGTENLAHDKPIRVLMRIAQTSRMVCHKCYGVEVSERNYGKRPKVKHFERRAGV